MKKRNELKTIFDEYKSLNLELSEFDLIFSDIRMGKLVALGNYIDSVLYLKTKYYTFDEMIAFLDGFLYNKSLKS